jgi:hypothetical protein
MMSLSRRVNFAGEFRELLISENFLVLDKYDRNSRHRLHLVFF